MIVPSMTSTGLPSTVSLETLMSLNASPRRFTSSPTILVENSGLRQQPHDVARQIISARISAPIAAQGGRQAKGRHEGGCGQGGSRSRRGQAAGGAW
jgi:hypothetical protein